MRIYELNTWVWLQELSERHGRRVTLATVPAEEWDALAEWQWDAVWLMGVWRRSPQGMAIARSIPALREEYRRALPDVTDADIVGSPYCIRAYVVDAYLGGPDGLAEARRQLAARGMKLLLDFVPNHVAPDHVWVRENPEYLICGNGYDLRRHPGEFFEVNGKVIAHGRDPYFPPWTDTAQLNAFSPGLRRAMEETLLDIAAQCDGVRCDMAMLALNDVFSGTWGARTNGPLPEPFWVELVRAVRERFAEFLFLAEAYWNREPDLLAQGFDLCYDKRLADLLAHGSAAEVRSRLAVNQRRDNYLLRFVENHDEPRAAAVMPAERLRAALVVLTTVPGAELYFHGQEEGRRVKLPVQLGRAPLEAVDDTLWRFHRGLLDATDGAPFRGSWTLLEARGWPDNRSAEYLLAWCWEDEGERVVVVVNLSGQQAQGRVPLPWADLRGREWLWRDVLSAEEFLRDGDELNGPGLFTDLQPWRWHVLRLIA